MDLAAVIQSSKLLDKIQKWRFVELANLLTHDTQLRCDTLIITQDGQSMIVGPRLQENRRYYNIPSGLFYLCC